MGRNRRAFTLVELLVVVGIIGMIMGMIVPSLVKVTDLAREAACKNNLHLLSKGAVAYLQAHNDNLPLNDYKVFTYQAIEPEYLLPGVESTQKWWCNKVYRYGVMRPQVYICPSDPGRAGDTEPVKCGYGFNNTLTNPTTGGQGTAGMPGDGIKTLFEIKDAERTAIIGHCTDLTREPAIVEEMADPLHWPRGHVRQYDRTAKAALGRVGFVMAGGVVQVKTFAQATKIKNDKGKFVLFRAR